MRAATSRTGVSSGTVTTGEVITSLATIPSALRSASATWPRRNSRRIPPSSPTSGRSLYRRSASVTIPTSLPSETTGTPLMWCVSSSCAISFTGVSGLTVITGEVITSRANSRTRGGVLAMVHLPSSSGGLPAWNTLPGRQGVPRAGSSHRSSP
jgi:hypothetical protein